MKRPTYPTIAEMRAADRSDFFSRKTKKKFGDQKYHAFRGHLIIQARLDHSDRSTSIRYSLYEFRPKFEGDCKMIPIGHGEDIGTSLDACKDYVRERINTKTSIWARES